jgi:hypothetical protein
VKTWLKAGALAILVATETASAQSDRELATRQELIAEASALADQGKHAEALATAKRAAAIKMTPSLRLFIAGEQSALGLLADAYGSSKQCSAEVIADIHLNNRDRIRSDCAALEESLAKRVAHVTVKLPTPLPNDVHVTISGEELNSALIGEPYVVSPGKLKIAVTAQGYLPFQSELDVAEGGAQVIEAQLLPDPALERCGDGLERVHGTCMAVCSGGRIRTADDAAQCCWAAQTGGTTQKPCSGIPSCPNGLVADGEDCVKAPARLVAPVAVPPAAPSRLAPLLVGGGGVVVGLVATVIWFSGNSLYSTLKNQCEGPSGCPVATYNSSGSTIRLDDRLGVGGWITGGAILTAGVVWYLVGIPRRSATALSVPVFVNPSTRTAGFEGVF